MYAIRSYYDLQGPPRHREGVGTAAVKARWIMGLVALACAVGSASGAPAKKAKSAEPDSNQVLVRIGRGGITRGDVERRIRMLPEQFRANYSTPEGRRQLIDRMVEELV